MSKNSLGAFRILLTFIKLPFVFKIFVMSICEWLLKTIFTVFEFYINLFSIQKGRNFLFQSVADEDQSK